MSMSPRTILVTGATGFLGKAVVPRLTAAGHRVRMLGRSAPAPDLLAHGEFVQGDLADRAAVKRALAGADALYHLAGMVSFDPADGPAMSWVKSRTVMPSRGLDEDVVIVALLRRVLTPVRWRLRRLGGHL